MTAADLLHLFVRDLMEGDLIDLEGDRYADPDPDDRNPYFREVLQEVCDVSVGGISGTKLTADVGIVYVAVDGIAGWTGFPHDHIVPVDPHRRAELEQTILRKRAELLQRLATINERLKG